MKAILVAAAAIALLAIAFAVTAPANLLDGRLSAASQGRLRIADASGTVWNGSGDLVLLPHGTRRAIAWHIDGWPLLAGELRGNVRTNGAASSPAAFDYAQRTRSLSDLEFSLPMDALLQIAGVPAALATASGNLSAHVRRLTQTPQAIDADLALDWQDASVPTLQPGLRIGLGDVRLELQGSGPEVAGSLSNRGGDVEIAGRVALTAALAPRIDATVRPRPGLDRDRSTAIAAALSLVGAADGQGGYRIAWAGR
jgi:general secretion pathway protein N